MNPPKSPKSEFQRSITETPSNPPKSPKPQFRKFEIKDHPSNPNSEERASRERKEREKKQRKKKEKLRAGEGASPERDSIAGEKRSRERLSLWEDPCLAEGMERGRRAAMEMGEII